MTARQRWAGRQFFRCGVAHTHTPGHVSGPKKKSISLRNTWCLDLLMVRHHATVHPLWDTSRPPSTHPRSRYVLPSPLTHTLTVPPPLSVRPPATHLTSPAPSRATVTPPIARTHATPCADCPHQCSPSSSHPVVCRAVPAPAARRKPNPTVCPPTQPLHSPTCHLPNTCHLPTVRASHCTCHPPC